MILSNKIIIFLITPKGCNYSLQTPSLTPNETSLLNHALYYPSHYKRKYIMSKQEIDRILNTDFAIIDHTVEEKINSIDQMTGKLSEKSNFLAQFQLMLQNELGNIKGTAKGGSGKEDVGVSVPTKKEEIVEVKEDRGSKAFQILGRNYPQSQPKTKQTIATNKKTTVSIGTNYHRKSLTIAKTLSIQIEASPQEKDEKQQFLWQQLNAAKIELQQFKLLITFLKEEIKGEIQYFKGKITSDILQAFNSYQTDTREQYEKDLDCLESEINSLKIEILRVEEENKVLCSQNPLKELTFHKNSEQKISSFNVTRRFQEYELQPSQYNSPDPHKPQDILINSDEWKTYRLKFDQNSNKPERTSFKPAFHPYSVPLVKTITVGIPPVKNGFGILKSGNETIYRGMWKDGKFQGSGKLNWDGYCYEGNFCNGAFEGHGRLHTKELVFVGKFKGSKAHGEGTLQTQGRRIMGVWQQGRLVRMF